MAIETSSEGQRSVRKFGEISFSRLQRERRKVSNEAENKRGGKETKRSVGGHAAVSLLEKALPLWRCYLTSSTYPAVTAAFYSPQSLSRGPSSFIPPLSVQNNGSAAIPKTDVSPPDQSSAR